MSTKSAEELDKIIDAAALWYGAPMGSDNDKDKIAAFDFRQGANFGIQISQAELTSLREKLVLAVGALKNISELVYDPDLSGKGLVIVALKSRVRIATEALAKIGESEEQGKGLG